MARKRKRPGWFQKCYKFRITRFEAPQELWDVAKEMRSVWNQLAEMHQKTRSTITSETSAEDRKTIWAQFEARLSEVIANSTLNWECKDDLKDRFTKACVSAAKHPDKGWPQIRKTLSVSIPHRYTGGGVKTSSFINSRSKRLNLCPLPTTDRQGRQVYRGQFGINEESMPITCVFHRQIGQDEIVKSVRLVGEWTVALQWNFYLVFSGGVRESGTC